MAFSESLKNQSPSLKYVDISTLALFNAMNELQPGQKCVFDVQSALKLFGGVFSSQNEPKTYL